MTVRVLLEPPEHTPRPRRSTIVLNRLRWLFLVVGAVALSYTGYAYLEARIYQAQQEEALEQELARARTADPSRGIQPAPVPKSGAIGRISIPRLGIRAIVNEGADERALKRGVGHVRYTAKPGTPGNVGLAAHRDTYFRNLRDVRKNDRIVVETTGGRYEYLVESTKIVRPKDVHVLAPTTDPVLTLVTCYPFNFVGNAPKRYIVRARQVSPDPPSGP